MERTNNFTSIQIPNDSASLARGQVLVESCKGCHGGHLDGLDFFNDEALGFMASPNITGAPGSATEKYTDDDWVKALRHGLNPEGRALMVMPSENFCFYSDQDLGSLIAYLKTIPKKERATGETQFTLFAKILGGAGQLGNLYAYDKINHEEARSVAMLPITENVEYGKYMVDIHFVYFCFFLLGTLLCICSGYF